MATATAPEPRTTPKTEVVITVAPPVSGVMIDVTIDDGGNVNMVESTANRSVSRRPRDLCLLTSSQSRDERDADCDRSQRLRTHQQMEPWIQSPSYLNRRCHVTTTTTTTTQLSSPLGVCVRHPSTPQAPGTCCLQDGHRDRDIHHAYQSCVSPSSRAFECRANGYFGKSRCCLHDSHPGIDCRHHAAKSAVNWTKVKAKIGAEECYVFTMTDAERCRYSPVTDQHFNEHLKWLLCSHSISPSSETAVNQGTMVKKLVVNKITDVTFDPLPMVPQSTLYDTVFDGCRIAVDMTSPIVAKSTLGLPEDETPRRRSVSAECGRMEPIAEEIQSIGVAPPTNVAPSTARTRRNSLN